MNPAKHDSRTLSGSACLRQNILKCTKVQSTTFCLMENNIIWLNNISSSFLTFIMYASRKWRQCKFQLGVLNAKSGMKLFPQTLNSANASGVMSRVQAFIYHSVLVTECLPIVGPLIFVSLLNIYPKLYASGYVLTQYNKVNSVESIPHAILNICRRKVRESKH